MTYLLLPVTKYVFYAQAPRHNTSAAGHAALRVQAHREEDVRLAPRPTSESIIAVITWHLERLCKLPRMPEPVVPVQQKLKTLRYDP